MCLELIPYNLPRTLEGSSTVFSRLWISQTLIECLHGSAWAKQRWRGCRNEKYSPWLKDSTVSREFWGAPDQIRWFPYGVVSDIYYGCVLEEQRVKIWLPWGSRKISWRKWHLGPRTKKASILSSKGSGTQEPSNAWPALLKIPQLK